MRTTFTFSFRVALGILIATGVSIAQEIRTVVADGLGSNPQSAAQDAAQNALTNVVGSFIDANKQLEKRTEIRDGIRSQTTQIRSDIKEYSQGSIQSFEIVETKHDGPLFRVTAKVGVRVAEFRAYVKKLAEGEVAVGGGLFAEMTTTQRQSESLAKILSERILAVVNGEVVRFSVSKPVPFRRSRFANGGGDVGSLVQRFSPDQLVVFEVTATLDEAFLSNFIQTLDSVTASKQRVSTEEPMGFWKRYAQSGQCWDQGSSENANQRVPQAVKRFGNIRMPTSVGGIRLMKSDSTSNSEASSVSQNAEQHADSTFCLPLLDSRPTSATVYRFSNLDHELTQYLPWVFERSFHDSASQLIRAGLEIAVLDRDRKELQVELIQSQSKNGERVALETANPWLLYRRIENVTSTGGSAMLRQRTFSVVMKVEDEALRQADSIRVKLVK